MRKQIDVVGAVIVRNGSVYCAQRGASGNLPGMWEFPGGKIENDESPQSALKREIQEELGCAVEVGSSVTSGSHDYDFATVNLETFFCELVEGEPTLSEHQSAKWLPPGELDSLEWAPADLPTVEILMRGVVTR